MTGYMPPLFTYAGDNFEKDFDIGLLSEYLFDGNGPAQSNKQQSTFTQASSGSDQIYGNNDFINFTNDDQLNFDDDDDDNDYDDEDDFDALSANSNEGNQKRRKNSSVKDNKTGGGDDKDQIGRRRERNRLLARKTRLRKKFFFETLQRQVSQLVVENDLLKQIAKQRLEKEKSLQNSNEINKTESTSSFANLTTSTEKIANILEHADFDLMAAIQTTQRSFCITDPSLDDNPIVFASKGFLELFGYSLDQVIGRNCRFLQGKGTDQKQVEILKKGILNGDDVSVCLLNYKADGTPFNNQIFISALRDPNNKITNYVGVHVEIKNPKSSSVSGSSSVGSTAVQGGVSCGESEGLTEGDSTSKDEKSSTGNSNKKKKDTKQQQQLNNNSLQPLPSSKQSPPVAAAPVATEQCTGKVKEEGGRGKSVNKGNVTSDEKISKLSQPPLFPGIPGSSFYPSAVKQKRQNNKTNNSNSKTKS